MKRKLLAVLLTCCMTAGMLAGCGGNSKEPGSAQPEQEAAGASAQAGTEAAAESTGENITIESLTRSRRRLHSRLIEMPLRNSIKNTLILQ